MKRILLLFFLLHTTSVIAEEEKPAELSDDQIQDRFNAAEERYKDNPDMLRVIRQIKEGYEDKRKKEETPPPAPPQPDFDASKTMADSAYNNADYETAFKHYKALAEEGDAEAAMMLGVMYQGGLGTEKNSAAAHAWYRKSSEENVSGSGGLLEQLEETDINPQERQEAENYYAEISSEEPSTDKPAGTEQAVQPPVSITGEKQVMGATLPTVIKPSQDIQYDDYSRQVRFTPERVNPMPHPSPEMSRLEHTQPERFYRKQPAG